MDVMPHVKKKTMNIKLTYSKLLNLSEAEQYFISKESRNFGVVDIKTYTSKFGALDLVSIIDSTLTFVVLKNSIAFAEGFIGEEWFKNLGKTTRQELASEIIQAKNFIKAYYEIFVKNNDITQEAFVISETIGEVNLFVVINHYRMTEELLNKLPQALVDCYGKISLGYIKIHSNTCQLFPDFATDEWRYLFNPSYQGFGNYVDQYFDLEVNKQFKIKTKAEFLEKFNLNNQDKYKLIINALIER